VSKASCAFDPIDHLVEAFLERYRRGERPSLSEYTDKHPELAERIRALFPAVLVTVRTRAMITASAIAASREQTCPAPTPRLLDVLQRPAAERGHAVETIPDLCGLDDAVRLVRRQAASRRLDERRTGTLERSNVTPTPRRRCCQEGKANLHKLLICNELQAGDLGFQPSLHAFRPHWGGNAMALQANIY